MEALSPTTVPVRIALPVQGFAEGHAILDHLVEERLVAGGTVLQAESLNWVAGEMTTKGKMELTAYTTLGQVPLIQERLTSLCSGDAPTVSRYVMAGEKEEIGEWIMKNVRS
ncbi:MAG TPA: divalent cation tolerance protein CutA [Candidatus Peribacterales bacterium]|nr:divalent cation tolerance protein CutA [Candidatus Peribacterales bacterium]